MGCASAAAMGGKCGAGAASGAFGSFAAPATYSLSFEAGLVASSVAGGVGSVLGGGKFANGAVTGAFGYLFNDLLCDAQTETCRGRHPTKSELDTHLVSGRGWKVYAEEMDPYWLDGRQFEGIPIGERDVITTDWVTELMRDEVNPFRMVGDRNIYGDFTATRVDPDHFLWRDTYGFEMHGNDIMRDAATAFGFLRATGANPFFMLSAKTFDIIGTKPVRIPGR